MRSSAPRRRVRAIADYLGVDADEMQVSEQTVRNRLAQLKEKQKAKKEEEEKK